LGLTAQPVAPVTATSTEGRCGGTVVARPATPEPTRFRCRDRLPGSCEPQSVGFPPATLVLGLPATDLLFHNRASVGGQPTRWAVSMRPYGMEVLPFLRVPRSTLKCDCPVPQADFQHCPPAAFRPHVRRASRTDTIDSCRKPNWPAPMAAVRRWTAVQGHRAAKRNAVRSNQFQFFGEVDES